MSLERVPQTARSNVSDHDALFVLNHRLDRLHEDVNSMKDAVQKLTEVITSYRLIEQEQQHTKDAVIRAFTAIKSLEDGQRTTDLRLAALEPIRVVTETAAELDRRLRIVETALPASTKTTGMVDKLMWTIVIAAGSMVGTLVMQAVMNSKVGGG